jgi:hypothetical protein
MMTLCAVTMIWKIEANFTVKCFFYGSAGYLKL